MILSAESTPFSRVFKSIRSIVPDSYRTKAAEPIETKSTALTRVPQGVGEGSEPSTSFQRNKVSSVSMAKTKSSLRIMDFAAFRSPTFERHKLVFC